MSSDVGTSTIHTAAVENIVISKQGRSSVAQWSKYIRQKPQAATDSFRAVESTDMSRRWLFNEGMSKVAPRFLSRRTTVGMPAPAGGTKPRKLKPAWSLNRSFPRSKRGATASETRRKDKLSSK